jgi:hypothetical protein
MVLTQLFQFLTRKQVNNAESIMKEKSIKNIFLSYANISNVSVFLYNMIKVENKIDYFVFRDKISKLMFDWIWTQPLAFGADNNYYAVQRLNNNFINEHKFIYDQTQITYSDNVNVNNLNYSNINRQDCQINKGNSLQTVATVQQDNNWNDLIQINKSDYYGNIIQTTKSPKNMLAHDYQNLDVWKKQEVYADFDFDKYRSFRDQYGYANCYKKMPFHFDRDPESFGLTHRDPERASLSDAPRAYDNDEYYRAKGLLRK